MSVQCYNKQCLCDAISKHYNDWGKPQQARNTDQYNSWHVYCLPEDVELGMEIENVWQCRTSDAINYPISYLYLAVTYTVYRN